MIVHERPGVYSSYDASSVVQRHGGGKVVGLAALSGKGESGQVVTLTSLEAGLAVTGRPRGWRPCSASSSPMGPAW